MSDCDTIEDSISPITPYPTHTHISTTPTNSSTLIKTVANPPYYNLTSTAIAMTELSSGIITATPTMSDHNTTEGSISSTIPYPTHTQIKNSTMATNSRTNLPTAIATSEPSNGTTIATPTISDRDTTEGSIMASAAALSLALIIFICVLVCFVIRKRKSKQDSREEPSNNIPLRTNSPTVLVIYSSNTEEKEQGLILTMISKLKSHEIEPLSHDCTYIRGSPSAWLESEVKKATTVLCVCNKEFQDEWEGRSCPSLPLVKSLQHLILATIQRAESLSKYAVVLLNPSHRQYIPTKYLQSESRSFTVKEIEAIVHYVFKIPYYELSNESTIDTPDSSE